MATRELTTPAASLDELREKGRLVVSLDGRGTVSDGILTCHWHHARFDLCTGGTFDQFADELRRFPVEIEADDVYVDLTPRRDPVEHQRGRLQVGLERNIPLVVAKAAIVLAEADPTGVDALRAGLDFGVRRRAEGWNRGLTTLTCFMNLAPHIAREERSAALHHGLSDVALEAAGDEPRFPLEPLPGDADPERLARWFRSFVEVRDAEGAERALVSAVRAGASPQQLADMLFAAATDHRYIEGGHTLDFVNKALEALDIAGRERAEAVLASMAAPLAFAERMEESNAWRHPVDLVALLEDAFERLPDPGPGGWEGRAELVEMILTAEAAEILEALLSALRDGASAVELASAVTFAAAMRIARFPTTNEFGDWDTAMHTFTFANAVEQGLRRSPSRELLRGVLDAAMSVHLDRFLNVPATRLPSADGQVEVDDLFPLLDEQQRVDEAAQLVASYLGAGGDPDRLIAVLGACLLREDRNFHTIQCVEAAVRQHELLDGEEARLPLIAAARYLAAHAPTVRSQRQTYDIARRLHRGERIYEDDTLPPAA
ncbi:MAG: Rieske (2Fe-2S) protein [Actinobacteria bacterium]|nr:MAG: Rieske (2Fe-2S) protein [Actinomycetota bacterium]